MDIDNRLNFLRGRAHHLAAHCDAELCSSLSILTTLAPAATALAAAHVPAGTEAFRLHSGWGSSRLDFKKHTHCYEAHRMSQIERRLADAFALVQYVTKFLIRELSFRRRR
jgi:hypothetical protein